MRPGKQSIPAQGPRWNLQANLRFIKERGVEGETLLEVGGGIGAVEIELLKAGMARAINVELTPINEAAARELLVEAGPLVHV